MKNIFVIIILFCSYSFAQVSATTQTGSVLVKKKIIEEAAPEIILMSPYLNSQNEASSKESSITIRGRIIDKRGISELTVNGQKPTIEREKEFMISIPLNDGANDITVFVKSFSGKIAEVKFRVQKIEEIKGPLVYITEPSVTRGLKLTKFTETILVKGTTNDKYGVKEVIINETKAALREDGTFSAEIKLQMGDNKITVKAINNKLVSTVESFIIERKADEIIASTGKYYAVIIGINKYKGVWPELKNAVNDAKCIEALLNSNYRFDEIISLYDADATRPNIISTLEDLNTKVKPEDNVFIYYSGHGEYKQGMNKGYWVPVNATTKSTVDFISNSDIQTFMNGINSKHTLLVSDACFSGDIFRGSTDELPFENSERYYKEVYKRKSRYALTSGGIEPVADGGREGHSVFTYYLLNALKEQKNKYVTGGEIFKAIEIPVTNNSEQRPVYSPIKNTGDEGGQFLFIKK